MHVIVMGLVYINVITQQNTFRLILQWNTQENLKLLLWPMEDPVN